MTTTVDRPAGLQDLRLESILRALPADERESLRERLGVEIDPAKRIDAEAQLARAMASPPEVLDPTLLANEAASLLQRLVLAGGSLRFKGPPPGLEALLEQGLAFAQREADALRVIVPVAYLLQVPPLRSEDRRGLRALLARSSAETQHVIASAYLGRQATRPTILVLEGAWLELSAKSGIERVIAGLSPSELRLLEGIEAMGGEVDSVELSELEREPMRIRNASGMARSKSGPSKTLERFALLLPISHSRFVIPSEVRRKLGSGRAQLREQHRARIRASVLGDDFAPRRAQFAADAGLVGAGLLAAAIEAGYSPRPGVRPPKAMMARVAQRMNLAPALAQPLVVLSAELGLWDSHRGGPFAGQPLSALSRALFRGWRQGVWDEAAGLKPKNDEPSPLAPVRELVLEALVELGEGRWVPWPAITAYVVTDDRWRRLEHLMEAWCKRNKVSPIPLSRLLRSMGLEILRALGVVDVGGLEEPVAEAREALRTFAEVDPEGSAVIRVTPRGYRLIRGEAADAREDNVTWEGRTARVGPGCSVIEALHLLTYGELIELNAGVLMVRFDERSIGRAIQAGGDASLFGTVGSLEATLPADVRELRSASSRMIGRAGWTPAAGFVWVAEPAVRERLLRLGDARELFETESPAGGLLVRPGVTDERVQRALRAAGVELTRGRGDQPPNPALPSKNSGGRA